MAHMPRLETGAKLELAARDTCGEVHTLTLGTWEKRAQKDVMYNLNGLQPFLRKYDLKEGDVVVFR